MSYREPGKLHDFKESSMSIQFRVQAIYVHSVIFSWVVSVISGLGRPPLLMECTCSDKNFITLLHYTYAAATAG